MYESQFTARAETYTDHDRRAADAHAAPAFVTLFQTLTRVFNRRPVSHPGTTVAPCTDPSPAT